MGLLILTFFGLLAAGVWNNGAHWGAAFIAALGIVSAAIYYLRNTP